MMMMMMMMMIVVTRKMAIGAAQPLDAYSDEFCRIIKMRSP